MRTKLSETKNFLELYLHQTGESEVPKYFHLWSCISLLSALAGRRYWYEKFPGKKLHPNLYTILIGPSGSGKGEAIDGALSFLDTLEDEVDLYEGEATGPSLVQYFARQAKGKKEPGTYLSTPELTHSVGSGPQALSFIKFMTELYSGRIDKKYKKSTVTHGYTEFARPLINWVGGTTEDWLVDSVDVKTVRSGFFARACTPVVGYDHDKRVTDPKVPRDQEVVRDFLHRVCLSIVRNGGPLTLSNDARGIRDHWYRSRPRPQDPDLEASFRRDDDMVLKIAIVLVLAATRKKLVIRGRQMRQAIHLVTTVRKDLPELIKNISQTKETKSFHFIHRMIEGAGRVSHTALLRRAATKGLHAREIEEVLRILRRMGDVETQKIGPKAGQVHLWTGRRQVH